MADLPQEIREELSAWIADAECILSAAAILVRHYEGTEAEDRLVQALVQPRAKLATLKHIVDASSEQVQAVCPSNRLFDCDRELALVLTGLMLPLVEPVPRFLALLRTLDAPASLRDAVKRAYGIFIGELSFLICYPLWEKYPETKPSQHGDST